MFNLDEMPEVELVLEGCSLFAERLRKRVALLAASSTPVLIMGPKDAGQEDIAHAIHRQSAYSETEYVHCRCHIDASEALDRRLFMGTHAPSILEKLGAGTVYFERVEEASPGLLFKIARYLHDHTVIGANTYANVRMLFSIIGDEMPDHLPEAFLQQMHLPLIELCPLDERESDIPLMMKKYIADVSATKGVCQIDALALSSLCDIRYKHQLRGLKAMMALTTNEAVRTGSSSIHAYHVEAARKKLEDLDDAF